MDNLLYVPPQRLVLAVDKAAFLASGKEGLIRVQDKTAGFPVAGATDTGRLIVFGDGRLIGYHPTILIPKVLPYQNAHIIEFQALCGMDASHLFK